MKNNLKPFVFSDVDGTLYGTDFTVRDETVKHIHRAINESDIEFVITTGNPPFERHQKLADQLHARYLITSNGATVFDNVEKKYLYSKEFNQEQQQLVIDLAKKYDLQLNFWNHENYFTLNHKSEFLTSWNYSLIDPQVVVKNADKTQKNVVKMELFGKDKNIEAAKKALEEDGSLEIINMKDHHLELTAKGVNKGSAIKWFLNHLHPQDPETVMVVGDSPNDIPMFVITPYSYAVANARDGVEQYAKLHTTAYDQNGVGMAIDDYLYRFKNIKPSK
ncbi:Cof-type HAD-IIB family hydrolase [Candidatus Mycoplasma pogonae]